MRGQWVRTGGVYSLLAVGFFGAVVALDAHAAPIVVAGAFDCDGDGIIEADDCNANGRQDECDLNEPAAQSYSFSPPFRLDLSDFTPAGFGVEVALRAVVVDVGVALYIEHPFQNDLVVTLTHGGVTRTLIQRVGSSCGAVYSADNFGSAAEPLVLDDAAGVAVDCYAGNAGVGVDGYAGPAQPTESLSAFDGLDAAGNWTLTVSDQAAGNLGGLWSWRLDLKTLSADCNQNEVPDECEPDCNNNHVADDCDIRDGTSGDCNADGVPDACQLQGNDCNGSGTPDDCELAENDCNHNGRPDECDLYGLPGTVAGGVLANDCNSNGVPDDCELGKNDCNANGYPDDCDIRGGGRLLFTDFENGLPDGWSVQGPMTITGACREEPVCDGNQWAYAGDPQTCSTGEGAQTAVLRTSDFQTDFPLTTLRLCSRLENSRGSALTILRYVCQNGSGSTGLHPVADLEWHEMELELGNDVAARGTCHLEFELRSFEPVLGWQLDAIELVSGSADGNDNGIPDECEADCNNNQVSDVEDITNGTSEDCNSNGIPDECENGGDCNQNQTPDACDISSGFSRDCNGGGVPDECEIAANPELDCDHDGALDGCELQADSGADCNANNVLDVCELADGTQFDCNENGVLDVCDLAPPAAADVCGRASLICPGTVYTGATTDATRDGTADCGSSDQSPDKWLRYLPTEGGEASVSLCGSAYDTVLSLHDSCPGAESVEYDCNDDSCDLQSTVFFDAVAGRTYWIRISGYDGATGLFQLNVSGPPCGGIVLDCNENGVPDSCDAVGNDRNSNGVPDDCETFPTGDFTGDGVVGLDDLPYLEDCLGGPSETTSPDCQSGADFDADGDVDLHDYSGFSRAFVMQ